MRYFQDLEVNTLSRMHNPRRMDVSSALLQKPEYVQACYFFRPFIIIIIVTRLVTDNQDNMILCMFKSQHLVTAF
jgi:hypothetical protein